jgi:hypothetical protein
VGEGTVAWTAEPLGLNYLRDVVGREGRLPDILTLCGKSGLFDLESLPGTVGAFPWISTDGRRIYIDLVNYDIDSDGEAVTPARHLVRRVRIAGLDEPKDGKVRKAMALSPDGNQDLPVTVRDGWATVILPVLTVYTSIILER